MNRSLHVNYHTHEGQCEDRKLREILVVTLREIDKLTFREIGRQFGVNASRAKQMFLKGKSQIRLMSWQLRFFLERKV